MTTTIKNVGYGTEYTDNFRVDRQYGRAGSWNKQSSGLFDGKALGPQSSYPPPQMTDPAFMSGVSSYPQNHAGAHMATQERDPAVFASEIHPSVYRETVVLKDDRGKYIDTYKNMATKPYGRRLLYDPSHPDKMYASQWSSELADHPGCYSFPTTTGLDPEIPFKRDLQWQAEGEAGCWPTELWKEWTQTASCPPYDGHDDQIEYSQYKVQVP